MEDKTVGHNFHETLCRENHREDGLDVFQALVQFVCVLMGKGSVQGQGDTRCNDRHQNEIFEGSGRHDE